MSERHDSVAVADESAREPQFAHQKSKAERAFIWRLDIFLLTFGCISQSMPPPAFAINIIYANFNTSQSSSTSTSPTSPMPTSQA